MIAQRLTYLLFISLLIYSIPLFAKEEIVVIVHPDNPISSMSKSQVIDLFMGKYVAFPNGEKAIPIDIEKPDDLKKNFYEQLVGLPLSRVNAYWSRIKFSGRARPPANKKDYTEAINFLKSTPNAIMYIPKRQLTDTAKVVFAFSE